MKALEESAVRSWVRLSRFGVTVPNALAIACPYCTQRVVFSLIAHSYDGRRQTASSSGVCPACRETAHFWCTGIQLDFESDDRTLGTVYMQPSPPDAAEIETVDLDLPAPLARAYRSAVGAFNAGNHVAAAVCCQRALESIFATLLPDEGRDRTLSAAAAEACATLDVAQPLAKLAAALRHDGALIDWFAMEREPSAATARAMISLLERLVDLLFSIPKAVDEQLAALGADTDEVVYRDVTPRRVPRDDGTERSRAA